MQARHQIRITPDLSSPRLRPSCSKGVPGSLHAWNSLSCEWTLRLFKGRTANCASSLARFPAPRERVIKGLVVLGVRAAVADGGWRLKLKVWQPWSQWQCLKRRSVGSLAAARSDDCLETHSLGALSRELPLKTLDRSEMICVYLFKRFKLCLSLFSKVACRFPIDLSSACRGQLDSRQSRTHSRSARLSLSSSSIWLRPLLFLFTRVTSPDTLAGAEFPVASRASLVPILGLLRAQACSCCATNGGRTLSSVGLIAFWCGK